MLDVLLIDDEYYVRESIKTSVDWNGNGFQICGEAEDGQEAYAKFLELKPDIALVDINMPIIDGLTLVKKIKDNNIKTKIIILTGYSKFEYAKKAVELGTYKYLLKPINEKELLSSLLEIKDVIVNEKKMEVQINYLKTQERKSSNLQKQKFFNELISDTSFFQEENLWEKITSLNINLKKSRYRTIIFEIDNINEKGWYFRDKELWAFALQNICQEIINKIYDCEFWFDYDDNLCCLLMDKTHITDEQLTDICNRINIMVYRLLQFTVSIGIGNTYSSITKIRMSYYEARACLKNKILLGENKIIFFKNINSQEKVDTSYYGINFKNDLTYNIRMNNTQEVKNIINKIFDYLKDNNATVETIYMYSYQLLSTVAEVVIDKRRDTKTYIKQKEKQYRIIMKLESIKAIKEYIIDIFIELTKGYRSSNRNNSDILIYNIKKYIKENYDNPDLKIDNIVNQFNFNYHYLCKLFKQQTKSTIGEYILQVRMRKAKELIFADYTCVETISIKVGYSDANYFSKRFKKYYGISPHKYIKNNRDKRIALQS